MGYLGNNGTLDTDYGTSVENRMKKPPANTNNQGAFRYGSTTHSSYADPSTGSGQASTCRWPG